MIKDLDVLGREDRVTDYVLPKSIKHVEGGVKDVDRLLFKRPLQIAVEEKDLVTIKKEGCLILDFGKEIHGGVRILTHSAGENAKIRIRFGESLSEASSELVKNDGTATNDHSLRDFEAELVSFSDMSFGQTGFRFLRIDFLSGFDISIKSIIGVFVHRDLTRAGSFICNDPVINKIFEVSAYTLELCMQQYLWDGVKRDRLVWIGDTHPETLGILSLFGQDKCVEEALDFVKDITPLPNFMNSIPANSLWWLCAVSDYYLNNENIDFLNKNKDYIVNLVKYIDNLVDATGNLNLSDYFLDWPTSEYQEESKAGLHALCSYAMIKAKVIFKALGIEETILDKIIERINKTLDGGDFKQVNAMKVLAMHSAPAHLITKQLEGGAKGMSSFMSYYILSSVAKAGRTAEAIGMMKSYFGGMLDRGATTFWEDFDIDWLEESGRIDEFTKSGEKDLHGDFGRYCYKGFRHSLCHGWASGSMPFLMEEVLGVKVLEPGCKLVAIKPQLGSLTFAKGSYPTPYGPIEIEHKISGGKVVSKIKTPRKVKLFKE